MKSLTNSGRKSAALSPTPRVSVLTPKMRRLIQKSSVVSFDIFDTLLLRPYIRPTDLFLHIEKAYNCPFFRDCRIAAEIAAREHTNKHDVTLDEIYDQIDNNFKHLKQTELDWERMVLRANPQIMEVYNFAKRNNKRIVIASDMYLPTKFIADVLHKNGFDGYEQLYVSGDCGSTKARGTMFQRIINDTGVEPKRILHIGDNRNSDYKKPRKYGIRSVWYRAPVREFIRKNTRIAKFHDKTHEDLGASILIGMLAYRNLLGVDDNYWHNLGYEYAGPVIYGYTRWIERVAKENNIDHLLFVARDGYTLQRVFNTFNDTIKNSYVYAPRFLNLICRLDYVKKSQNQSQAIIDYFATKDKKIANLLKNTELQTWSDYHEFIQNNIKLFSPLAEKERLQYKKYLNSYIKPNEKIGVVDTLTTKLSSQHLINETIDNETFGVYWTRNLDLYRDSISPIFHNYETYLSPKLPWYNNRTKNWNFMEFLMTAPEYPIKNLRSDGTPVYDSNPSEFEEIRKQIYPYVSNGGVDFAMDIKNWFKNNDIYLPGVTLVDWVNCLCDWPTKSDFKNMKIVRHAWDSAHSLYQPIFCCKIPFVEYILHPQRSKRLARGCRWRTPMQTLVSMVVAPIKIKMRGIKQLRILLFPRMHNTYFRAILKFTTNCFYEFVIGNPTEVQ